jgi:hypothetical protein
MTTPNPLLSCPFCQGPAIQASGGKGEKEYFGTHCSIVTCPGGSMGLFHKTQQAADAAWNTRHGVNVIDALNALPEAFTDGLVQLLNQARCLSPRAIGNRELASSVSAYFLANLRPGDASELRRMLCTAFAGHLAYMDDGEAQDARALPVIDFMRDSVSDIKAKMLARLTAQPSASVSGG